MSTPSDESSSPPTASRRRTAANCVGLLIVGAIVTGVWMAARSVIDSNRRHECRAHLKQIGVALHEYHDRYGSFPPAYVADEDGKPRHSWRVLLLPLLGEEELYRQYRFDEPWDGPSNRDLAARIPAVYACPACGGHEGVTNYLAILGRTTSWPEQYSAQRKDFADGLSSTIQVIEFPDSDVLWLEPRDRTHREFTSPEGRSRLPAPHNGEQDRVAHCLFADGSVRSIMLNKIEWETLKALLTMHGGRPLARIDWPDFDSGIARLPEARAASEFRSTDVIPSPDRPIVPGRNLVYCATFELAWDNARRILGHGPGGGIELEGAPELAETLNRHSFDRRNLSEDAYVAYTGAGTEAAREQIREKIENRFHGSVPRLLNEISGDRKALIYAYLLKSLPFETAFDSLEKPLIFQAESGPADVASFGFEELDVSSTRGMQLRSQVTILDFVSNDDFIVRLSPHKSRDEIVLAKVAASATLEETIDQVRERIAHPAAQHSMSEVMLTEPLIVPKLAIGVERQYSELTGRDILGTTMFLALAAQTIRFRLDENGAVLESEAAVVGEDGMDPIPPGKRKFIFDRPFLVCLIERDATQPYFAMWVANAEVMEQLPASAEPH